MIFWEIAKRNLRIHLLRSSLAMLGIVIGVVAIASMGILGNSLVLTVSDSLKTVGDSVIVTPHVGGTMGGFGGGAGGASSLRITEQNFQQIKRASAPNVAIPILQTSDRMKLGVGSDDIVAAIYGLNPDDVPDLLKLKEGGYSRGDSGCLVGSTFAEDHNVKVGSRIAIGTDGDKGTLRVTGIIEERGMAFDVSTDSAIVVTKDWFDQTYDRNDYDKVVVKVKNLDDLPAVKTAIENQMNKRDKIVDVVDTRKTMETIFSAFGQITTFVSAIGGISMLVAGVSILNIMMMSVTERIKEIGIMRSIGAQRKEVMSMFLYEALILGVVG
ncbi:MAG: ABC transporter permease, partial [Methanoregula sp.]|nr:ABC transporter permease [Methanoregula sp.]